MATGAPDGVLMIQVAVTVNNVPVAPQPAAELAAGDIGRYSGVLQTYQTVATWTVAVGKAGELKEITCLSSDYTKSIFRITVDSVTFCEDTTILGAIPIIFEDLKLAAGAVVLVEVKSSDGTSITVDAIITGKEIG